MKAKNKIEREVVTLSAHLPRLTKKQIRWAIDKCSHENVAYRRHDRNSVGSFYLVTVCRGWQVLRYFKVYVKYRYHKQTGMVHCFECMQQWLKDGKYVFLSKQRMMGYYTDGFCVHAPMEVRTNTTWGFLGDPRDCGWDDIYWSRVQKKYKYILRDFSKDVPFDELFRTVNASAFGETLLRQHKGLWKMCRYRGVIYDRDKLDAVKIALRHGYEKKMTAEWFDMIDCLSYLKKDIRNPVIICPADLMKAHDDVLDRTKRRKESMGRKMSELRKIASEKAQLAWLRLQERRHEEQKKELVSLSKLYLKKRKAYFGISFREGDIEVHVLKSVDEFFEEGKEMHHCVFSNGYYDVKRKPNCLIMSARVKGERMETIEVDLKSGSIIQSRGKYNQNSSYHNEIVTLVRNNISVLTSCVPVSCV